VTESSSQQADQADQANRDATLLRELATAQLPSDYAGGGHGE
jgi:hypothetical protein